MSGLSVGTQAPVVGGLDTNASRESASALGARSDPRDPGLLPTPAGPVPAAVGGQPDADQAAHFAALLAAPVDGPTAAEDPGLPVAHMASRHAGPLHDVDPWQRAARQHDRQPDERPDREAEAPLAELLPSPMALFARAAEPATAAPPAAAAVPTLDPALALHIERLAVGDDRIGQRRVRLTLADALLPDTEVELGHEAGALQVNFFCHRSAGCQALQAQAQSLADQLATRLRQDVWLSVGDARRDDPGRLQVQARPDRLADAAP